MKRVLAIVLTVVMLIGLCACGGVSLKGTEWKLTSMTTNGLEVDEAFLSELGISGSIVGLLVNWGVFWGNRIFSKRKRLFYR